MTEQSGAYRLRDRLHDLLFPGCFQTRVRRRRKEAPTYPDPVEPRSKVGLWPNKGWDHGDMCDANGCRHGCCPCIGEPYCTPPGNAPYQESP